MSKSIERQIIGELVLSLTDENFRVEFCAVDNGDLYLYAKENGAPDCKYLVKLVAGNGGDIITDYSLSIQPRIKSAIKLGELLKEIEK